MDGTNVVFDLYQLAMLLVIALPPIALILWVCRMVGRRVHKTVVQHPNK